MVINMIVTFENLKKLVEISEAFYSVENEYMGETFTTFTYRLASYSDFKDNEHLGSLEARGITFRNSDGKCVSRPMAKFFNLNENPYTEIIDYSDVQEIQVKEDGSLISTVNTGYEFILKSKAAFYSDQAKLAMSHLDDNPVYKNTITTYLEYYPDRTINFEICSPENRIVLMYPETKLIILNIRDNITGEYYEVPNILTPCKVDSLTVSNPEFYINSIYEMSDELIEGFVIKMGSGLWFKVKTNKYSALHRAVDQIKLPKHILDVILLDASDDIKVCFKDTPELLQPLLDMEATVIPFYNHLVATVEQFNAFNVDLTQKEYAIKAMQEHKQIHGLLMSIRNGKVVDYYKWMTKHYLELYG